MVRFEGENGMKSNNQEKTWANRMIDQKPGKLFHRPTYELLNPSPMENFFMCLAKGMESMESFTTVYLNDLILLHPSRQPCMVTLI